MYARLSNLPSIFHNLTNQYGDTITIYRTSGNLSTSAIAVKGRQVLSPYEINFMRFMEFAADSPIVRGDHIKNESTDEEFFIAATEVETSVSAPMNIYTELYMINYPSIAVQRSTTTYDQYGNATGTAWDTVVTLPMNVRHVNGNVPYKDGLLLPDTVFRCIAQTGFALEISPTQDRLVIDGKNYAVTDINLSISPGLQVVQVKTDTRT